MEVRKVRQYRVVAYPDKEAVQQDGSILKAVPTRWKKNTIVCAALAVTGMMMLTSCGDGNVRVFRHGRGSIRPMPSLSRPMPSLITEVAGMVATGSFSILLDEGEAFRIIAEEAEAAGLEFQNNAITLDDLKIPQANLNGSGVTTFGRSGNGVLQLDGYNKEKKVAFEFVSGQDIDGWKTWEDEDRYKRELTLDLQAGARALARNLGGKTDGITVGVFYDPVDIDGERYQKMTEEEQAKLPAQAEENLREQVRDFINWLKAESII